MEALGCFSTITERRVCCFGAALLLIGCSTTEFLDKQSTCSEQYRCAGNMVQECSEGRYTNVGFCARPKVCVASLGRCASCFPGAPFCQGDDLHQCRSDGTFGTKIKSCSPGWCTGNGCADPCKRAETQLSYVGCSYWPSVTSNTVVPEEFRFAVAVANTSSASAKITIASSSATLVSTTVAGNSVATIKLPWGKYLRERYGLISDGAYHLKSSLPVTVYQFNALDYVLHQECKKKDSNPTDGKCYSWSNDASLLLPEHSLSREYMVISWPTHVVLQYKETLPSVSPGFFAVVAARPGTTKMTVSFSADAQGFSTGVDNYSKGQTASFSMKQFDVAQLVSRMPSSCTYVKTDSRGHRYCDLSQTTDLTGTVITADREVAVFAGHNCTFIPFDKWACDHLEEQLFPVKSWGRRYVGTHTISSKQDPNIYRVVSAAQANKITFDPPVHKSVVLDRGKFIDITTTKDFEARGTARFALAQFMVGQNYSNPEGGKGEPGDPSMALAVPVEQYRSYYRFLAPTTYQQNYVNVIAPTEATVLLDGSPIQKSTFTAIGASSFGVAKIKISGGSHTVESSSGGVGIAVYGVGSYTSYMYPGGLDLKILK